MRQQSLITRDGKPISEKKKLVSIPNNFTSHFYHLDAYMFKNESVNASTIFAFLSEKSNTQVLRTA